MDDSITRAFSHPGEDKSATLAAVESHPTHAPADDPDFIQWLARYSPPVLGPGGAAVFEAALTYPETRRPALNRLGMSEWYAGNVKEAATLWRTSLDEGRSVRDRDWHKALNSVALVHSYRGRVFESLVLCGLALRERPPTANAQRVFSGTQRTRALLRLDQPGAARRQLDESRALVPQVADDSDQQYSDRVVSHVEMLVLSKSKRWDDVLATGARFLAHRESVPLAVQAGIEVTLLDARYERGTEDRAAIVEEFATIADRFSLTGRWRETWEAGLHFIRWRHAVHTEDAAGCEREARAVLPALSHDYSSERFSRAMTLIEAGPVSDEVRAAYEDVIVDAVLRRLSESIEEAENSSVMSDATSSDWQILAQFQQSLFARPDRLRRAIADRWKPGLPAYDRLVRSDVVLSCAWCGRLRTRNGTWVVSEDLGRLIDVGGVSHGICASCIHRT